MTGDNMPPMVAFSRRRRRRHLTRRFAAEVMAKRLNHVEAFDAAFDTLEAGTPLGDL